MVIDDELKLKRKYEGELIDLEIEARNDFPYAMALLGLGIFVIIAAMFYIIFNNLIVTPAYIAFNVMGLVFFVAGFLWKKLLGAKEKNLREEIENLGNIEEDAERAKSNN